MYHVGKSSSLLIDEICDAFRVSVDIQQLKPSIFSFRPEHNAIKKALYQLFETVIGDLLKLKNKSLSPVLFKEELLAIVNELFSMFEATFHANFGQLSEKVVMEACFSIQRLLIKIISDARACKVIPGAIDSGQARSCSSSVVSIRTTAFSGTMSKETCFDMITVIIQECLISGWPVLTIVDMPRMDITINKVAFCSLKKNHFSTLCKQVSKEPAIEYLKDFYRSCGFDNIRADYLYQRLNQDGFGGLFAIFQMYFLEQSRPSDIMMSFRSKESKITITGDNNTQVLIWTASIRIPPMGIFHESQVDDQICFNLRHSIELSWQDTLVRLEGFNCDFVMTSHGERKIIPYNGRSLPLRECLVDFFGRLQKNSPAMIAKINPILEGQFGVHECFSKRE
ncbi:MAG: hypothetical protein EXR81_04245 [Gammaproteobacteria bacterium]|nr:hypothetical protein [Gammaproteobacteria bacterium]